MVESSAFGNAGEVVAGAIPAVVAILLGDAGRPGEVRLFGEDSIRDGSGPATANDGDPSRIDPGRPAVMPIASWQLLAEPPERPRGAAVILVPEPSI